MDDGNDEEEEKEIDEEDTNAEKPEFKKWLVITKANTNTLRLILKMVECIDDDFEGDDGDDGFEDCMDDDEDDNQDQSNTVIDLDLFK